MAKQKLEKEYMPLNIMELNAYEVVYYYMVGKTIDSSDVGYKCSAPMSLDLFNLGKICGGNVRLKRFLPGKYLKDNKKEAALEKTDAIVNINFDYPDIEVINNLEFDSPEKVQFNMTGNWKKASENKLSNLYSEFFIIYQKYISYYNYEIRRTSLEGKIEIPSWNEFINYRVPSDKSGSMTPEEAAMLSAVNNVNKEYEKAQNINNDNTEIVEMRSLFDKYFEYYYKRAYLGTAISRTLKRFKKLIDYYVEKVENYNNIDTSVQDGIDASLRLRILLYTNGLDIAFKRKKNVHYVNYKRSASKAKKGNVIFIAEQLYKPMMAWTWLGLPYEDMGECDLTSKKAYEALVMSSIVNRVKINNPKESILMLNSVESPKINGNRKILIKEKDDIILLNDEQYKEKFGKPFEHHNVIWDGMALVDKSVFEEAGYKKLENGKDKSQGMMLLRNSFFKACAFNTNITEYYEDNNIKTVEDMFGRKLDASKIKMIVTIDSLKLNKFSKNFFDKGMPDNPNDEAADKCMYEYWLEHIDDTFGIVKEEHESHIAHGKMHEVSYQMLNTLPLSYEDMRVLAKDDIDYIKLMKKEPAVMAERLKNTASSVRKRFYILNMIKYAPDFENTSPIYTKFLDDEVEAYRKKMKKGRLKIRSDFYVLCSMPMEMLEYSAHKNRKIKSYLKSDEAYIDETNNNNAPISGERITLLRYPHMNSGSFCALKQTKNGKYIDQIHKYFNLSHKNGSNIIIVSPWESNIMIKLGGADFDSDTALVVYDETIKAAVDKLNTLDWIDAKTDGTPVALADEKSLKGEAELYTNTPKDMAILDQRLSDSKIGVISDDAQLCNCIMWDVYNKLQDSKKSLKINKRIAKKFLQTVYDFILILSVLNELEIDRPKHSIEIVPDDYRDIIKDEVIELAKKVYKDEKYVEDKYNESSRRTKACIPAFLYEKKGCPSYAYRRTADDGYWDVPTDYIFKLLDEEKPEINNAKMRIGRGKSKKLHEYFDYNEVRLGENAQVINKIRKDIREALAILDSIDSDKNYDELEKDEAREEVHNEVLNNINIEKLDVDSIKCLLSYAFATYTSSFGEHRKGEYKYKEFAINPNRGRYLGLIFAIGENNKGDDGINLAAKCIKDYDVNKLPKLIYEPQKAAELVAADDEDHVVIFGEVYKKKYN